MTPHDLELAMKTCGRFGAACFNLANLRTCIRAGGQWTDNEIEEQFENMTKPYRKCFNKQAFIAACREPD